MSLKPSEIILFPLGLVLNPGGRTSLRIFEPRYMDMVRECTRNAQPFGICARIDDNGKPAVCAVGTTAKIVDFYTLPDGLLGIEVEGGERFHVDAVRVRDNGLSVASFRYVEPELKQSVPPEYALLADLVSGYFSATKQLSKLDPGSLDDAAWVSFRLADVLPLELIERQRLLEMPDPRRRLQQLLEWLPRFRSDDEPEEPAPEDPSA
jgi:uncharacterized protein